MRPRRATDLFGHKVARVPPAREIALHGQVADALRWGALPNWRFTHFPAGEQRDPRVGAKLQRMGLAKGWPDLILLAPNGGGPRFMELKRAGMGMTPEQALFRSWCEDNGYPIAVSYDLRHAVEVLNGWGALRSLDVQ